MKTEPYLGRLISLTSKLITYWSKLKFFILIDLFKFYFTLKLIPLRSKLINAQKIEKNEGKRVMLLHTRIGPPQINGLIRPSFCVILNGAKNPYVTSIMKQIEYFKRKMSKNTSNNSLVRRPKLCAWPKPNIFF